MYDMRLKWYVFVFIPLDANCNTRLFFVANTFIMFFLTFWSNCMSWSNLVSLCFYFTY